MTTTIRRASRLRHFLHSILLFVVIIVFAGVAPVSALTPEERRTNLRKGISFYDDACIEQPPVTSKVALEEQQKQNAKTIIGIAKTYKLEREGALIGLMVGITESNLYNAANTKIPVSLENPNKQGDPGSDGFSVGVMQQQTTMGWSTFGSGTGKDVTWQLMDVAYAAQAFYGTPPGATITGVAHPEALQKGLQNKKGWASMDPWVAAQAVQVSAFSDGSNYKSKQEEAESYLDQLWESTSAVRLPIPVSGGTPEQIPPRVAVFCQDVAGGTLLQNIVSYAWPKYRNPRCTHPKCVARNQAIYATTPTPGYRAAIARANTEHLYTGWRNSGIDCGAFVTRLMQYSRDPNYNKNPAGNTVTQQEYLDKQVAAYEKMKKLDPEAAAKGGYVVVKGVNDKTGTQLLKFGDIAVNSHHTLMYTGPGVVPDFEGNSVSASGSDDGPLNNSDRAPMATSTSDFGNYTWYRLEGVGL